MQQQFREYFVHTTCCTAFNLLNFMGNVTGTKYPPNCCCTIIISSYERTCHCNISLGYVRATFLCASTSCDFVPATFTHYASLLHDASMRTTQVFCHCNMSLQHNPLCLPTFELFHKHWLKNIIGLKGKQVIINNSVATDTVFTHV